MFEMYFIIRNYILSSIFNFSHSTVRQRREWRRSQENSNGRHVRATHRSTSILTVERASHLYHCFLAVTDRSAHY